MLRYFALACLLLTNLYAQEERPKLDEFYKWEEQASKEVAIENDKLRQMIDRVAKQKLKQLEGKSTEQEQRQVAQELEQVLSHWKAYRNDAEKKYLEQTQKYRDLFEKNGLFGADYFRARFDERLQSQEDRALKTLRSESEAAKKNNGKLTGFSPELQKVLKDEIAQSRVLQERVNKEQEKTQQLVAKLLQFRRDLRANKDLIAKRQELLDELDETLVQHEKFSKELLAFKEAKEKKARALSSDDRDWYYGSGVHNEPYDLRRSLNGGAKYEHLQYLKAEKVVGLAEFKHDWVMNPDVKIMDVRSPLDYLDLLGFKTKKDSKEKRLTPEQVDKVFSAFKLLNEKNHVLIDINNRCGGPGAYCGKHMPLERYKLAFAKHGGWTDIGSSCSRPGVPDCYVSNAFRVLESNGHEFDKTSGEWKKSSAVRISIPEGRVFTPEKAFACVQSRNHDIATMIHNEKACLSRSEAADYFIFAGNHPSSARPGLYIVTQEGVRFAPLNPPLSEQQGKKVLIGHQLQFKDKNGKDQVVKVNYFNEELLQIDCWKQIEADEKFDYTKVDLSALDKSPEFDHYVHKILQGLATKHNWSEFEGNSDHDSCVDAGLELKPKPSARAM